MAPIDFRDFVASAQMRREAWRRRFAMEEQFAQARPNDGHRAVAALVARGTASHVVTQNIDNLHQMSGVPDDKVIELHGNTRYAKCLECGARMELAPIRAHFERYGDPPDCACCGGMVKTATISFGQAMPELEMARAEKATLACDLFLVLGSSLVVYPAAGFPLLARRHGARLAIVKPRAHRAGRIRRSGDPCRDRRHAVAGGGFFLTPYIWPNHPSPENRPCAISTKTTTTRKRRRRRPSRNPPPVAQALFKSRTVLIFGEVDMKMAERVSAQLLAYAAEGDGDIRVILNSPGGHVESGDTIHDMIRFVGPRVKMIGTGWVASAGAHIFLGAKKENRFCLPFTRFLLHQPLGGVRGQVSDITIEAEEILKMRERLNREIAAETGQSYERVLQDTERNYWLGAEDAKAYGLVSRVIQNASEV